MVKIKLPVGTLVEIAGHRLEHLGGGEFASDNIPLVFDGNTTPGTPAYLAWPTTIRAERCGRPPKKRFRRVCLVEE